MPSPGMNRGPQGPRGPNYQEYVQKEIEKRDFLVQQEIQRVTNKLPEGVNSISEFDQTLFLESSAQEHILKETAEQITSAENHRESLELLRATYIKAFDELMNILARCEKSIDAREGDIKWIVSEEKDLIGFEKYQKEQLKGISADAETKAHIELLATQIKTMRGLIDAVNNMSADKDSARNVLLIRKGKIIELHKAIDETMVLIEDALYRQKMTIPKAGDKKETATQKREREERIRQREQAAEDVLYAPGEPRKSYEDLEKEMYAPLVEVGVKKSTEHSEPTPQEVLPGGWVRPSFLPPETKTPSGPTAPPSFLGPQDVAFSAAEAKRIEIIAKRTEWKQLKENLDATESAFRVKEREQFQSKEKVDSPELLALRDALRQAKIKYIKNIKENTVLRQEEKTLREGAHAPVWNPTMPRKDGASLTPSEKNPERSLNNAFANRFIVEAAQKTLEVKKAVVNEQRGWVAKSFQAGMGKLASIDPVTRKRLVWGGRAVGIVAVSGVAAFAAPLAAGTAALGAASTYAARLGMGMAGGGLAAKLMNNWYGRKTSKVEARFADVKTENASRFAKKDLSEDAFKAMEQSYSVAQENARVSQRNRTLATWGARAVGSFGAASLTELAADFMRPVAPTPERPGAPVTVLRIEEGVIPSPPGPPTTVPPFTDPGLVGAPGVPTYVEVPPPPQNSIAEPTRFPESEVLRTPDPYARQEPFPEAEPVGGRDPYSRPQPEQVVTPRAPEMVTIRSGDNLWRLTNQRYSAEFQNIPNAQRDRILSEVFREVQGSAEAKRALGLRSGNVNLIYPNENLNFQDIHERLQYKLNIYRLNNNLPLPVPSTPAPAEFVPTDATPVRLNVQLPEQLRADLAAQRAQIQNLTAVNDVSPARVVNSIPNRLEVPATPPPPGPPPSVPNFVDPGLNRAPAQPGYVPTPLPVTGRLNVIQENGEGAESIVGITRRGVAESEAVSAQSETLIADRPVAPQNLNFPRVLPGEADPERGEFGRLVEQVYRTPENFALARENMVGSVVPMRTSWFDSLIGNRQGNLLDQIGDLTLEDFDELANLSRSELGASLRENNIPMDAYTQWRQMIAQMRTELAPNEEVTVNELINHHVLRNADVYQAEAMRT